MCPDISTESGTGLQSDGFVFPFAFDDQHGIGAKIQRAQKTDDE
jgi:hypothetical protein